jgi:hypothetical protein
MVAEAREKDASRHQKYLASVAGVHETFLSILRLYE